MSNPFPSLIPRTVLWFHGLAVSRKTCGALYFLAGAISPWLHAQYAHVSGVQIAIPTSALSSPSQLAVDASGILYIADTGNGRVLKETPSAGNYIESVVVTGLSSPKGIAVDTSGAVYIADADQVLKETATASGYTQTTIVSGLSAPNSVAVDTGGKVYIADAGNNRVLLETPSAGSYTQTIIPASALGTPFSIAIDKAGSLYIADTANARILKETPSGVTYIESLVTNNASTPGGITVDTAGNIYFVDATLKRLLKMAVSGTSYVFQTAIPFSGLSSPQSVAVDGAGNIYLADANRILESPATAVTFGSSFDASNVGASTLPRSIILNYDSYSVLGTPTVSTQGIAGLDFSDKGTGTCTTNGPTYFYGRGDTCTVDIVFSPKAAGARYGSIVFTNNSGTVMASGFIRGMGLAPIVHFPTATYTPLPINLRAYVIAIDAASNLYVADNIGPYPANKVTKEAWNGSGYTETLVAAVFTNPVGIAVDGAGNVYVADNDTSKVTKWTPAPSGYTLSQSYTGFTNLHAIAVDGGGNLYVGSTNSLAVFPAGSTVPYIISQAFTPIGIAIDFNGVLYATDDNDELISETLTNGAFTQATIATGFYRPHGLTVDNKGNVYVADMFNYQVVKLTRSGDSYSKSVFSSFGTPLSIAFDPGGNFYATSDGGSSIYKLDGLTPPALTFPKTDTLNTSRAQSVTLANDGNTSLTFPLPSSGSNPAISTNFLLDTTSSAACPQVSAASGTPATLAPGSSCELSIRFAPATGGNLTGSLILTDDNLNTTSPYATQTIALNGPALQVPTISYTPLPSPILYGVAPFPINVITNSDGALTYTVRSGPATLSGSTATVTGIGSVVIDFILAETSTFTGGKGSMSFEVLPIGPHLTFTTFPKVAYGDPPFTISTTSDSPGLVTYTIVSGPATVSGSTITITGVGVVSLVANQAATGNYDTATTSMSFGIGAGTAAITLAANSSSTTVSAGGTATFSLTLIPIKTFLNNITLSVSGLPTGATAAFSPAIIAAGSGSTPVTLSIQASPQTARVDHPSRAGFETIALGLVLLPLAGFKPNRRLTSSLVAIAVLSLGTLLTGCSSGTSGSGSTTTSGGGSTTTPKSYPLVITAKDTIIGSQISGNLTLTVQ